MADGVQVEVIYAELIGCCVVTLTYQRAALWRSA